MAIRIIHALKKNKIN